MKVKRRMQIMAILPIVLALVTSMILAWMTISMHSIVLRMRAVNTITRDVFLLDMITHKYLQTPTLDVQQRWQTIHARLAETIGRETLASPRDRRVFDDIHHSLNDARYVFFDFAARNPNGKSPSSGTALDLLDRLSKYSQAMVAESLTLAAITHDQASTIQLASFLLIIGISSALAILLAAIAVLVSRRIDNGLAVLRDGTHQVAQGNLGHEIQLDNQDEFGELAAAFNTMSRELKKDQDTIHDEMAAREKISASLSQSNIQLSDALTRLKRAQEEAIQRERLMVLKQVADGILHDIYDAMLPILGFSELMLRYPDEMQKAPEHMQTIHRAVTKAISVARHLSEYFYPTQQDNATPINLNTLLESVLARVLSPRKEEGRKIIVKTEWGEISAFNSIEEDLNEALAHIIANAVDALEGSGTLTVRTRMEADTAVIEVSDTGPGMDPKTRQRCLEPFYSTKGHGHSGMGLAITQGAIARCQGALIIESLPGKGTTVIFRMPTMPITKAAPPAAQSPPIDHKLRILVIDDEAPIRKLLMQALKSKGYEVEIASDGPSAIEIFRSGLFNVVIVDLAMPLMNGNEVAAAIKQMRPRIPVIMLTGFGDVLTERGEKPVGVDFLLSKPMTLDDLQNAITSVIGHD